MKNEVFLPSLIIDNAKYRLADEKNPEYKLIYENFIKIISYSQEVSLTKEDTDKLIYLSQQIDFFHKRINTDNLDKTSKDIVLINTQKVLFETQNYMVIHHNYKKSFKTSVDRKEEEIKKLKELLEKMNNIINTLNEYNTYEMKGYPKFLIEYLRNKNINLINEFEKFQSIVRKMIYEIKLLPVMTTNDYEEMEYLINSLKQIVETIDKNKEITSPEKQNQIIEQISLINQYFDAIVGPTPTNYGK